MVSANSMVQLAYQNRLLAGMLMYNSSVVTETAVVLASESTESPFNLHVRFAKPSEMR